MIKYEDNILNKKLEVMKTAEDYANNGYCCDYNNCTKDDCLTCWEINLGLHKDVKIIKCIKEITYPACYIKIGEEFFSIEENKDKYKLKFKRFTKWVPKENFIVIK